MRVVWLMLVLTLTSQAQILPFGPVFATTTVPPAGAFLWLSADCITFSGTCQVPSNGSSISTWYDQSIQANSAGVSAGTCTFNTAQINGRPAVALANCKLDLGVGIACQVFGCTFLAVVQVTNTSSKGSIISGPTNATTWWVAPTLMQGADQSNNILIGTGTAGVDTSWHQLNMTLSFSTGVQPAFRLDRATDALQSGSNTVVPRNQNQTSIGYDNSTGAAFFAGNIAELLVYRSVLIPSTILQAEAYFHQKYGL